MNLVQMTLILPLFVKEGKNKVEKINSMPGVFRYSVDKLDYIMKNVKKQKYQWLHFFHIFLKNIKKTNYGSEALNENNLICRSIKRIKKNFRYWCYV